MQGKQFSFALLPESVFEQMCKDGRKQRASGVLCSGLMGCASRVDSGGTFRTLGFIAGLSEEVFYARSFCYSPLVIIQKRKHINWDHIDFM